MKREVNKKNVVPVSDFVDAVDAKGIYLYRKDGYILSYLRIMPFNIDLLSDEEKEALNEKITAQMKSNRKNFIYASFPREVDLDGYKGNIKEMHRQQQSIGKRHILACMMKQANDVTTDGSYEHHHFLRVWEKNSNKSKAEEMVKERIENFYHIYKDNGIDCEVLSEREIIKLCNLFGNSLQVNYESVPDNAQYTPIMWID